MSDNSGINLRLAAGVGVALALAASSVGMYYLLKRDEEEDELQIHLRHPRHQTSRTNKTKIRIRSDAIGAVIGRHGANVRAIEAKTKTRIMFEDEPNGDKIAEINGSDEALRDAEEMIMRIVNDQPIILTEEFKIPIPAVGGVIGRNGEVIKRLCQTTGARIIVARESSGDGFNPVTLKGTPDQISKARKEIDDIVFRNSRVNPKSNGSAFHQKPNGIDTSSNRDRQAPLADSEDSGPDEDDIVHAVPAKIDEPVKKDTYTTEAWDIPLHEELTPTLDDGLHVFVSHADSPSKFWVQVYGPKSNALDKLSNEMASYYELNARKDRVTSVKVGDIVASTYTETDESWYRVRIIEIQENHPAEDSDVTVFYLDFGGTAVKKRKDLSVLKHNFLIALSFQAVECSLYGIVPADDGLTGDHQWSEEAISYFNKVTHTAEWVALLAKPKGKIKIPDSKTAPLQTLVELIEFRERPPESISIAKVMISKGYARSSLTNGSVNHQGSDASSSPSSPSNISTPPDEFPFLSSPSGNSSAQLSPD